MEALLSSIISFSKYICDVSSHARSELTGESLKLNSRLMDEPLYYHSSFRKKILPRV